MVVGGSLEPRYRIVAGVVGAGPFMVKVIDLATGRELPGIMSVTIEAKDHEFTTATITVTGVEVEAEILALNPIIRDVSKEPEHGA